jgi:multiple sugar transport system permease protein
MPHVIIFLGFFIFPMLYGIYVSFTKWNLFNSPQWIGLANYRLILFNDDSTFFHQFWNGLKNTFLFVIMCVPFQIVLPLALALALYARPRGSKIFQAVFYLPNLFSITAVALTWLFIFNRSLGLLNRVLRMDINWYGRQPFAWLTILITTLWWVIGANMIIYIAALSGVERELLEAGEIDGASRVRRFWNILLPSIRFPLIYTLIISIISQFNIYGQPLMLTTGGPSESTFVLLMYIRNLAFGTGTPVAGISSAMAVCLGLVIGVVSLGQMIVLRRQD